ncbi:MAG: hypothetical protein JOZ51_03750 [Chloroflexi bacterium]|nr:hypothetical protein [Chloroflexota bacterium]
MKVRVYNLGWLQHMLEQHDLCAHGAVEVEIGGEHFERDDEADWCVSAAALFLLRTLTRDHTASSPVGNKLIPCCGHAMYVVVGEEDVEIDTCPTGLNWEVQHLATSVLLRTEGGTEEYVTPEEWEHTVFQFADSVEDLYKHSLPKEPENSCEAAAYAAFQAEWSRRRGKRFLGN